ncbi:hypothetical protein MOTT27_02045 [Mycobacterium intracellulare subsp. yongonense]|nr:hypothetical protein MOTT27_02045 [Mycobacterium intracellulare subsp. yongonense]
MGKLTSAVHVRWDGRRKRNTVAREGDWIWPAAQVWAAASV